MSNIVLLSKPTVTVDNVAVTPEAGTAMVKLGTGEVQVEGISGGAGTTDVVISEDVKTQVASIQFKLPTTNSNVDLFRLWQAKPKVIGLKVYIHEDDFSLVCPSAIVTNDPEITFGPNQYFEVQMKGPRMS